ncbi:MAG TPA: hypothetical protein VER36_07925 [Flavisolibacter sp.]|nr:hypothetical protein [Flavisolibacter sp.]
MIRSLSTCLVALSLVLIFASCNRPSAEKAFDVAVLNTNMIVGFANSGMERHLESPSMKMGKTKDEVVQMKRKEVVDDRINFVQGNYEKLKSFSVTDDTKDIVQASLALHEMILPVYKNEYAQLAKLYDEGAPKEEIEKQKQAIHDNYFLKFEALFNKLINSGKLYAKEHDIKVNWAM